MTTFAGTATRSTWSHLRPTGLVSGLLDKTLKNLELNMAVHNVCKAGEARACWISQATRIMCSLLRSCMLASRSSLARRTVESSFGIRTGRPSSCCKAIKLLVSAGCPRVYIFCTSRSRIRIGRSAGLSSTVPTHPPDPVGGFCSTEGACLFTLLTLSRSNST